MKLALKTVIKNNFLGAGQILGKGWGQGAFFFGGRAQCPSKKH
jgi:hypothetical protein